MLYFINKEVNTMEGWGSKPLVVTSINQIVHVNSLREKTQVIHRNRPCYGLVYKLSGRVVYHFEDRTMESFPGCVCLLPKGSNYRVERVEHGECIAINFQLLDDPVLKPFSEPFRSSLKFETLFRRIDTHSFHSFVLFDYRQISTLYEILDLIDKASRYGHLTPAADGKLQRIVSAIDQRYGDPRFSLSELAAAEGFPMTSMRDAFLKVYGLPPIKYLTMLRLSEAKKLLSETDDRIEDISHACGFSDQFYFSRVFKNQCGVSPSEYRKNSMMNL